MKRLVLDTMLEWKASKNRKVLLLRGPRQVGKTYIASALGKTFKTIVEVNFEKDADVKQFFEQNYDPERICNSLSAYYFGATGTAPPL